MNNNIQCSIESSTTKIELNSAVEGVFLVPELDGLAGLPDIRTTSGVNAGYDGGWTSAQNYDARLISIRGVIANPDVSKVEAKRRAIASLLGQGRKEQLTLRFTTEAGNSYVIYVRTISCEMALQRVLTTQEFLIQLRADDPLIYDDGASSGTEAILQVQKALGGFEIDFELPLAIGGGAEDTIVENGSETVYPIINLYGPLHSPTVVNRTTNQQMQILADLQYTISWSGYQTKDVGAYDQLDNELDGAPMSLTELNGNATQTGAPTPDSPVAINTVTGEQVVKVEGKNLLNIATGTLTDSGVEYSRGNGTISATGTSVRASYAQAVNLIGSMVSQGNYPNYATITTHNSLALPSGTYTLSATIANTGDTHGGLYIGVGNVGSRPASGDKLSATGSKSVTLAEGQRLYLDIWYEGTSTNKNVNLTISNIQLELGSTATTYEPYQGQEFEVNLGKNLLYQTELPKTQADVLATYNDGVFSLSGTANANSNLYILPYTQAIAHLEAGESLTYYLERVGGTSRAYFVTYFIPDDGSATDYNWQLTMDAGENSKKLVKTATKAGKVAYAQFFINNGVSYDVQVKVLVQKGNIANPTWAEYFAPIELAKIGTYQDKIYYDADTSKWMLHKEVGKVVLDGTEWWGGGTSTGSPTMLYSYTSAIDSTGKWDEKVALSNNYTAITTKIVTAYATNEPAMSSFVSIASEQYFLRFMTPLTVASSIANFKTWLGTHNTTVYYVLATATDTEITNSALLEQLNAILPLFGGVNNISIVGTGAQGEIVVKYATVKTIDQDVAVIDSQARTITLNGQDIYHLKTEESEFLLLAPGDNKLYLTSEVSDDSGYAEVKFKQGYLSI